MARLKGKTMRLSLDDVRSVENLSSREAGRVLGVGKTTVNEAREFYKELDAQTADTDYQPKIVTLDIETKPLTAYVWGIWDQNVGLSQIKEHGGMMCFAAKWLGDPETVFFSEYDQGYDAMLKAIHQILSEADIVITYNGDRFDLKRINNEFLKAGMGPPRPYKSIDLIKTNRSRFDLPSRKLDYLVQQTGVGAKLPNGGFDLWVNCMAGDPEAWALMEEYNRMDVHVTEGAYLRLLPWLTNIPHMGMFTMRDNSCPYCGKRTLVQDEQYDAKTLTQSYPLYSCATCGGWSRGTAKFANSIKSRPLK